MVRFQNKQQLGIAFTNTPFEVNVKDAFYFLSSEICANSYILYRLFFSFFSLAQYKLLHKEVLQKLHLVRMND